MWRNHCYVLLAKFTECLGGSWHVVFQVEKKSCTVDDLKDMIKTEISFYRMETIPESFYLCEQETKRTQRQQTIIIIIILLLRYIKHYMTFIALAMSYLAS